MKQNEDVKARIAEIQDEKAKALGLSRGDIIAMVVDDRELARSETQCATALRACELLGRELHGMFTERREIATQDVTRAMGASELAAALLATAKAIGLSGNALMELEGACASLPTSTASTDAD